MTKHHHHRETVFSSYNQINLCSLFSPSFLYIHSLSLFLLQPLSSYTCGSSSPLLKYSHRYLSVWTCEGHSHHRPLQFPALFTDVFPIHLNALFSVPVETLTRCAGFVTEAPAVCLTHLDLLLLTYRYKIRITWACLVVPLCRSICISCVSPCLFCCCCFYFSTVNHPSTCKPPCFVQSVHESEICQSK